MSEEDYGVGLPRGTRSYIKRTDRRVRHLDCRLQTIILQNAAGLKNLERVQLSGHVPNVDHWLARSWVRSTLRNGYSDRSVTEFHYLDNSHGAA
jgi:hypothetical protein